MRKRVCQEFWSQAGVAQREEDTIQFAALVDDQQDLLRELLSFEPGPLWDAELLPISEPKASFVEIDTKSAIAQALKLRPEVLSQQLALENRHLDQRVERRQRWPQLDLDASYQFSGISGTPNDPDLVLEQEGNAGAIQQVLDGDFDGWNVGLTLSYPLRNRAARARHARAELAVERGQLELEELHRAIRANVRRTARAVLTAQQRIDSAQLASELTRRNLEAEQKRYENGLSSSFTLLRIQEDLAGARQREVVAVTNHRRQLIAFQRATGTLLDELGVMIEEPAAER